MQKYHKFILFFHLKIEFIFEYIFKACIFLLMIKIYDLHSMYLFILLFSIDQSLWTSDKFIASFEHVQQREFGINYFIVHCWFENKYSIFVWFGVELCELRNININVED